MVQQRCGKVGYNLFITTTRNLAFLRNYSQLFYFFFYFTQNYFQESLVLLSIKAVYRYTHSSETTVSFSFYPDLFRGNPRCLSIPCTGIRIREKQQSTSSFLTQIYFEENLIVYQYRIRLAIGFQSPVNHSESPQDDPYKEKILSNATRDFCRVRANLWLLARDDDHPSVWWPCTHDRA